MQAQVAEADFIQKADSAQRLAEDVFRDLALERGQFHRLAPRQQTLHGKLGDTGDPAARDAHAKRLRPQLGTLRRRTLARRLVLPKKDADVLLGPLLLEIAKEAKDSFVSSCLPVQQ